MTSSEVFSVQGAKDYANKGQIEEWVHEFLTSVGKNPDFSDGLKLQKRYWAGPLEMELDKMTRCCGPEENMKYKQSANWFYYTVNEMIKSLEKGWNVPPLIVQYHEGSLVINDGNHRYEALKRCGINKYWVILWFADKENYIRGIDALGLELEKFNLEI